MAFRHLQHQRDGNTTFINTARAICGTIFIENLYACWRRFLGVFFTQCVRIESVHSTIPLNYVKPSSKVICVQNKSSAMSNIHPLPGESRTCPAQSPSHLAKRSTSSPATLLAPMEICDPRQLSASDNIKKQTFNCSNQSIEEP